MAAFTSILMGAAAAASAGTQIAGAVQRKKQAKEAKQVAQQQKAEQDRLQAELQERQQGEEAAAEAGQQRDKARRRQKQLAAKSQGRSGTILTSPLGSVGDQGQQSGKTLLGV